MQIISVRRPLIFFVLIFEIFFFHHINPAMAVEFTLTDAYNVSQKQIEIPHLTDIKFYNQNYFLLGYPDTKIHLSVKWNFYNIHDDNDKVYFGYSQQMMWELLRDDPYMRDVNYNPDFFLRHSLDAETWIDVGVFEHESNGRGGAEERSWNRTYLRYQGNSSFRTFFETAQNLDWSIKTWVPYSYNPSNTNLAEYRGFWELEFALFDIFVGNMDQQVIIRVYPGDVIHFRDGGQELTIKTSLPRKWGFKAFFIGQLFHGYGETLLNYDEETWGIRGGIGF